ncbi:MAG: hypothetical protein MUO26_01070, partial [Methanotrichaceae archaeon]|nr:hypothetical protein [Methanotrichaceae archaeon]
VKLKLIGYSIIVAMIFVIMASVASADFDDLIGGAIASSKSGSGDGMLEQHFVYDTTTANNPILWVSARVDGAVLSGAAGTFIGSFDTVTKKTKSAGTLVANGYNLNVGVDGKVAVNIAKTSTEGNGVAYSELYAESTVDIADREASGEAEASAFVYLDGTGTISATTNARDLTYNTYLAPTPGAFADLNAPGYVKGTVALTGQTSRGGTVFGEAEIESFGEAEDGPTGTYAEANVEEEFNLFATNGISFDGRSQIAAIVNGEEFAEPTVLAFPGGPVIEVADIEAFSKLSGLASVFRRNDVAVAMGEFGCYADSQNGVYATELTELGAYANRLVADPDPANAVRATSKLESAEWSAAAADLMGRAGAPLTAFQMPGPIGFQGLLASVSGETGFTENGNSIMLPGSGVGAASTGANQVMAMLEHEQEAWADDVGDIGLYEEVEAIIMGPQFSGVDTGGAGAYCGVANQNLFVTGSDGKNEDTLFGPILGGNQFTAIETIANQNMIIWTNGALLVPGGHQSFSKPIFSITPQGIGFGVESGPNIWYWQAAGQGGALFLYETGVIFV